MLYFCSFMFRNLLAYAMQCQSFAYFCSRHAPRPSLLASQRTRVCLFVSKCLFSVICLIAFFIFWNDFVCSSFQSILLFFIFSLSDSNGRNGADSCDRFAINFCKWCMLPTNDLSCFWMFLVAPFLKLHLFCLLWIWFRLGWFCIPAMLFLLPRTRYYVGLLLGFLCPVYLVICSVLFHGSWVILLLWLLYRLKMHVPNWC